MADLKHVILYTVFSENNAFDNNYSFDFQSFVLATTILDSDKYPEWKFVNLCPYIQQKIIMTTLKENSLFEEPYASVAVREDQILSVTLRGFLRPEHATKVSSVILFAVSELKLKLLLINQKDLKVLSKEIQNRFAADIVMVDPFISRAAIIEPENIFADAGLKAVQRSDHANKGKNFTNEDDAVKWLLQDK